MSPSLKWAYEKLWHQRLLAMRWGNAHNMPCIRWALIHGSWRESNDGAAHNAEGVGPRPLPVKEITALVDWGRCQSTVISVAWVTPPTCVYLLSSNSGIQKRDKICFVLLGVIFMKCHPWIGLTSPKCSRVGENSQVNRKREAERREGGGIHNKEEEEE